MNINRRKLLKSMIGTAAVSAMGQNLIRYPLLASTLPEDLATDPRRPQFHLLPAANWMNDPNGPIYWNNRYHMFYQYNPNGAVWGDMHWGHAISDDMVHWTHLPVALAPTPGGPDADGCFSGTAVVSNGVVGMLYTGVVSAPEDEATIRDGAHSLRESQCLATSNDPELRTWSKLPAPVIAAPPPGLQVTGFRDPSPWRDGDWWYMVVGSGIQHRGGAVLLYRSKDLTRWEYLHMVASHAGSGSNTANPVDSGDMWECPDLFSLGSGKHVLIYSAQGKAYWQSGVLNPKELVFHPEQEGVLDHGSFYAPKTQLDKMGNRILWGWIPESRPLEEYRAAGWAGMMSLPRVLTLNPEGRLTIQVSSAVDALRRKQQTLKVSKDKASNQRQIDSMRIDACCGEIVCTARRTAESFELSLASPPAAGQSSDSWIALRYDPSHPNQIFIDGKVVPIDLGSHEDLELHFYIDGSVIEAFVNKHAAFTKRFYYPGRHEREVRVHIVGDTTSLSSLTFWQLAPISSNRLTG